MVTAILVAEDSAVSRELLMFQLGLLGFEAEAFDNGADAAAAWRTGRYAMLLTDDADDSAQVFRALAEEFEVVEVSTRPDLAVADFERFQPDVVVLAFDTIERAASWGPMSRGPVRRHRAC